MCFMNLSFSLYCSLSLSLSVSLSPSLSLSHYLYISLSLPLSYSLFLSPPKNLVDIHKTPYENTIKPFMRERKREMRSCDRSRPGHTPSDEHERNRLLENIN